MDLGLNSQFASEGKLVSNDEEGPIGEDPIEEDEDEKRKDEESRDENGGGGRVKDDGNAPDEDDFENATNEHEKDDVDPLQIGIIRHVLTIVAECCRGVVNEQELHGKLDTLACKDLADHLFSSKSPPAPSKSRFLEGAIELLGDNFPDPEFGLFYYLSTTWIGVPLSF
jgi:hypothetical protein